MFYSPFFLLLFPSPPQNNRKTHPSAPIICLLTAHPAKFPESISRALSAPYSSPLSYLHSLPSSSIFFPGERKDWGGYLKELVAVTSKRWLKKGEVKRLAKDDDEEEGSFLISFFIFYFIFYSLFFIFYFLFFIFYFLFFIFYFLFFIFYFLFFIFYFLFFIFYFLFFIFYFLFFIFYFLFLFLFLFFLFFFYFFFFFHYLLFPSQIVSVLFSPTLFPSPQKLNLPGSWESLLGGCIFLCLLFSLPIFLFLFLLLFL